MDVAAVPDILFLCQTNASLSPLAEALVNARADQDFRAFSAGWQPAAALMDECRRVLARAGLDEGGLSPKPWTIFALPGARRPDLVVDLGAATVGGGWQQVRLAPHHVHWPMEDPAHMTGGAERTRGVRAALRDLELRLQAALPQFRDLCGGREAHHPV